MACRANGGRAGSGFTAIPRSDRTSTLEFERDLELGAIRFDLALRIELKVELDDFGDAKVTQGFSGPVDGRRGRLFPDSLLVPTSSTTL